MILKDTKRQETLPEGEPEWQLDVVCGMDVEPRTTPYHHTYNGTTYYFCNKHCLKHFVDTPERYIGDN